MNTFQNDKVYCLHNTGNNYQTIFFSERNRDYFTKKIEKFIKPFAKVIKTFLPDNQFFILIKTHKDVDLSLFNKNIGIMLGSYAQGVNKEQGRLGALFRAGTKAYTSISQFPKTIRKKITVLRIFLTPSRKVKFAKTVENFLQKLKIAIDAKTSDLTLIECLFHPLVGKKPISISSPKQSP